MTYYTRAGKARTAYDQQKAFGFFAVYELPVGKGQKWLNRGGVLNAFLGGWKVNVSENTLSGIPISVTQAGSPNRTLLSSITRVNAVVPIEQARVQNWEMGNRFPTAAQNPYLLQSAFAYPDAYTIGTLGSRVVQAPPLLWMQFFITKSWYPVGERFKLSFRLDWTFYGTHAAFVAKVREAAASQVAAGYLLQADATRIVAEADASAVLRGR